MIPIDPGELDTPLIQGLRNLVDKAFLRPSGRLQGFRLIDMFSHDHYGPARLQVGIHFSEHVVNLARLLEVPGFPDHPKARDRATFQGDLVLPIIYNVLLNLQVFFRQLVGIDHVNGTPKRVFLAD